MEQLKEQTEDEFRQQVIHLITKRKFDKILSLVNKFPQYYDLCRQLLRDTNCYQIRSTKCESRYIFTRHAYKLYRQIPDELLGKFWFALTKKVGVDETRLIYEWMINASIDLPYVIEHKYHYLRTIIDFLETSDDPEQSNSDYMYKRSSYVVYNGCVCLVPYDPDIAEDLEATISDLQNLVLFEKKYRPSLNIHDITFPTIDDDCFADEDKDFDHLTRLMGKMTIKRKHQQTQEEEKEGKMEDE
jgi:hypothetical protein